MRRQTALRVAGRLAWQACEPASSTSLLLIFAPWPGCPRPPLRTPSSWSASWRLATREPARCGALCRGSTMESCKMIMYITCCPQIVSLDAPAQTNVQPAQLCSPIQFYPQHEKRNNNIRTGTSCSSSSSTTGILREWPLIVF